MAVILQRNRQAVGTQILLNALGSHVSAARWIGAPAKPSRLLLSLVSNDLRTTIDELIDKFVRRSLDATLYNDQTQVYRIVHQKGTLKIYVRTLG